MSLGRDRVFYYASLEELKEEYTKLLKKAKEISLEMDKEIKKVSSLESRVPYDVKSNILINSLDRAKIEKDMFDDLINKLNKNVDKLLSELPNTDSIASKSMSKLTDATKILTSIINDYQ